MEPALARFPQLTAVTHLQNSSPLLTAVRLVNCAHERKEWQLHADSALAEL